MADTLDGRLSMWLLRAGLAFVFLYAAAMGLVRPDTVVKYMPSFTPGWAIDLLLPVFAVYEVVLALCLFSRRYVRAAAVLSVLTLAGINLLNLDAFGILFRNVAIMGAAAALCLEAGERRQQVVDLPMPEAIAA
ncbi:MAG: hypothetical protein LC799_27185 [Actinobacteria bacterium]|nr:hypothetical protein [Actinomycetota bacterium]